MIRGLGTALLISIVFWMAMFALLPALVVIAIALGGAAVLAIALLWPSHWWPSRGLL